MKITIYQVDAFTEKVFGGNPAAVCPLDEWIDEKLMQNIALENNLSETAFFVPKGDEFEIRWFTPKIEINLAGHPTLASAHVIFEHLGYNKHVIHFHTMKSGILKASKKEGVIRLDFPGYDLKKVSPPEELLKGLGAKPDEVLLGRDYFAVYKNEKEILALEPDFRELAKLDCLGIVVTAPGERSDFVSRFFAPRAGINEDPVTGSAHTLLIPYWAKRLKKNMLHAYQVSERRGELFCEYLGERVIIGGRAVTFMKGEIIS
jgi:PhzF family phenazine biosynthesis protein